MKKRNKKYVRKPIKGCQLIVQSSILYPIENILNRLEIDGTVDVTRNGVASYYDGEDLYSIAPALLGLVDWIELTAKRNSIEVDMSAWIQLAKRFELSMPIDAPLLKRCQELLPKVKRFVSLMNPVEGKNNLNTVRIKWRLHGQYQPN